MNETAQQYIRRITAHVEGKKPLAVQAATAKKLKRLIGGVPASELRKRPAADKWSVNEIMAHLADVEIVIAIQTTSSRSSGSWRRNGIRRSRSTGVFASGDRIDAGHNSAPANCIPV